MFYTNVKFNFNLNPEGKHFHKTIFSQKENNEIIEITLYNLNNKGNAA